MPVPLLDVSRQHEPLKAECEAVFAEIYDSGRFILGDTVERFEAELATYTATRHAIGVSSGTDALLLAMMALDIGPGDEVLCPSFTFFATGGCIARTGATPVWVDVLPDSFNLDLRDAEAKVTDRTKAIVPVHLFGQCCDMECVLAFAEHHELYVIEDAAQAIGARFQNRPAGSMGAFGAFSFYPTKNLGAFGDAGALVTQDDALAERAIRLRNHGMFPRYYHHEVGGNFRIDAIQAGLLSVKMKHLETYHRRRQENAGFYQKALADLSGIELPQAGDEQFHVWNQFTIKVSGNRRDALRSFLAERKIGAEIYYPVTLDQQKCFQGNSRGAETIQVSHELAQSVLSIPIFPELTEAELTEVADAIRAFVKG
jgi:dTDP-4-amino-4,6-dideoxygalactose transaminase